MSRITKDEAIEIAKQSLKDPSRVQFNDYVGRKGDMDGRIYWSIAFLYVDENGEPEKTDPGVLIVRVYEETGKVVHWDG